jgi:lipopolysaccharide heptosyltransferase II
MGDVLMTVPAIRALGESGSSRRITLLTSSSGAEAALLVPLIDEVIVYEAPWMKASSPRADSGPDLALVEQLRRAQFDAAVIFTVYSQTSLPSTLLCYLAGIPLRLAFCRENPYQLLTDWVPELEPQQLIRHEVRRQLDLVATVGFQTNDERMAIRIPDRALRRIEVWLHANGFRSSQHWAVIHPGSTASSRRYSPESYAEVAGRLVHDHGLRLVFTGGITELATIESIRLAMGDAAGLSLAGKLNLAELAALIAQAPLLISNNTGPVHIAASVGTPVVDLYALTNPQHTPWGVPSRVLNHDVPCKYCYKSVCPEEHHNCLRLVTPGQVVDAAVELLGIGELGRPVLSEGDVPGVLTQRDTTATPA